MMNKQHPEVAMQAPDRLPAISAGRRQNMAAAPDKPPRPVEPEEAASLATGGPHLMVNAPLTLARLEQAPSPQYDLLELFAFVRPAAFLVPTIGALAAAVELPAPLGAVEEIDLMRRAAKALLGEVASGDYGYRRGAVAAAELLSRAGWSWAPLVLTALGEAAERGAQVMFMPEEWRESGWRAERGGKSVHREAAIGRLRQMLGENAEMRPTQEDYTAACCTAFQAPRKKKASAGPKAGSSVSLLEAGTGIGKTLAYIAPASLWAEENGGTVWLSTYTRNLQRQLDQELSRLYPDPAQRARRAVVRKGRENYLCLLNLEESLARAGQKSPGRQAEILLGLILRWLPYSRDGDMAGGDFPRWLTAGAASTALLDLTDRRGECIHSACAHYKRCFIERSARKARAAHLVVANHALVLTSLAQGGNGSGPPKRLVFDEGHHLFNAADQAFALALSGRETAELRRWILGVERSGRGRARGLASRIGELTGEDREASAFLDAVGAAASILPAPGWQARLQKAQPRGPAESFLLAVRSRVLAAARPSPHTLEITPDDPGDALSAAAHALEDGLATLGEAMTGLADRLQRLFDEDDAAGAGPDARAEAAVRGLTQRAATLCAWRQMLLRLAGADDASGAEQKSRAFVDWLAIRQRDGRETDLGLYRHWLDPTLPFAEAVLEVADGVIVTSATLRDEAQAERAETGWRNAEARVGAHHLVEPPVRASFASPFDYAAQTRVMVITDISKSSPPAVAGACRDLFLAAGGGALGIFTAIARLRGVHREIAGPLEAAGIGLYAQHVDPMDTGTLVDIFRAEENACLLGTDAVRDGIDVPGRALRLIVFDRVPWPRPTILHRARRAQFGGRGYDESLVRLRLKQAYGRLVRNQSDRGIFVILDAATPSRLLTAYPEGVAVSRLSLAAALAEIPAFLNRT